jgi:hypothetical protein
MGKARAQGQYRRAAAGLQEPQQRQWRQRWFGPSQSALPGEAARGSTRIATRSVLLQCEHPPWHRCGSGGKGRS